VEAQKEEEAKDSHGEHVNNRATGLTNEERLRDFLTGKLFVLTGDFNSLKKE
jgi:hypothetical protein